MRMRWLDVGAVPTGQVGTFLLRPSEREKMIIRLVRSTNRTGGGTTFIGLEAEKTENKERTAGQAGERQDRLSERRRWRRPCL